MAKLSEKMFEQDGKLVIQQTHNFQPVIDLASRLRSEGLGVQGENKVIGVIPAKLSAIFAKEAGVKYGSPEHMEVMHKKLLSGELSKLRVWEGSY